jgi:polyhydroxyalkanoate synthesis regulator phasin
LVIYEAYSPVLTCDELVPPGTIKTDKLDQQHQLLISNLKQQAQQMKERIDKSCSSQIQQMTDKLATVRSTFDADENNIKRKYSKEEMDLEAQYKTEYPLLPFINYC